MRSLEQWLAYQAQVHPQAIDLGLERLRVVLERLKWRQPSVPVITVAGTNGKGSVSAFCAAILNAAGFKTGTFTSPHLRDYRERIRVHDRLASAAELVAAFEKIEAARASVGLTFFEFNALAALLIFEAARLDAWVLEVGMGGRLDAVNVVDPSVAVVTSIGFDHQEYLGDTLEAIAREKAGIFRPGKTAVIGSREPSLVLEEIARSVNAPLKRLAHRIQLHSRRRGLALSGNALGPAAPARTGPEGDYSIHQCRNGTGGARGNCRLDIPAAAIARGLAEVRLVGRFQSLDGRAHSPTWILDVAHNPDAARVLARNLSESPVAGRTLAICGILADKDAAGIVATLDPCIDAWWCASADGARGRSGAALAELVRNGGAWSCPCRRRRRERLCRRGECRAPRRPDRRIRIFSHRRAGDGLARIARTAAAGGASRIYFAVMDRRVKERLIGASILVVLVVLVVPELLSGPKPPVATAPALPAAAPEPLRNVTVDLTTNKAPANADAEPASPQAAAASAASAAELPPVQTPSARTPAAPAAAPLRAAPAAARPAAGAPRAPPVESAASSPTSKGHGSWSVQLGSFASRANAENLTRQVKGQGFAVYVLSGGSGASPRYRVRVGPLADRESAERMAAKLKSLGHVGSLVAPTA